MTFDHSGENLRKANMAIVLLHGLMRDKQIMRPMEHFLGEHATNHKIYNFSYPTRKQDFPYLVDYIHKQIESHCDLTEPLNFVGHSMGGIMSRLLLQQWQPPTLGRVVQVGSPNRGTAVVDFLNKTGLFKYLYGIPASRLGTDQSSITHELKPVEYDLGIIAADKVSFKDAFFDAFVLNKPNDGLVEVQATRVDEMKDFTTVHATHVDVISDPMTFRQVLAFMENGSFIAS